MGFTSPVADPDIWLTPAIKYNGEEYHEYILCYVDDVLGISADALGLTSGTVCRICYTTNYYFIDTFRNNCI